MKKEKEAKLAQKIKDHDEMLEILSQSFNDLQKDMHSNLVHMTNHLIDSLIPKIREIVYEELKNKAKSNEQKG